MSAPPYEQGGGGFAQQPGPYPPPNQVLKKILQNLLVFKKSQFKFQVVS